MKSTTKSLDAGSAPATVAIDKSQMACTCGPTCACGSNCKCQPGATCSPACKCVG